MTAPSCADSSTAVGAPARQTETPPSRETVLSSRHVRRVSRASSDRRDAMKRSVIAVTVILFSAVLVAQRGGPSPEMQAAIAKQEALEKSTPRLQATEEVLSLSIPNHTIGEAVGVAKNSKGHLFVFTRSGNVGPAKGATASQLYEFDPANKFVKQWGPDNYAA